MAPRSFPPGPGHRFPASGKGFLFPPVVWAVHFVVIYSVQGAGCAGRLQATEVLGVGGLSLILGAVTAVTAAAILVVGLWAYRDWHRIPGEETAGEDDASLQASFLAHGALLNAGLFFVATLWIGIPSLMVGPCGELS